MKYLDRILQPGERVEYEAQLHPIIFLPWILLVIAGIAGMVVVWDRSLVLLAVPALLFIVGVGYILYEWIQRWTTEIAITDRRVVYKLGLIRRDTIEMNRSKIESIDVSQTILGRLFDYGTVTVRGTGEGISPIRYIKAPLKFRGFIIAR
jgi:uncharacterized membrane protein YdbT with pleckstrin-like domain